MTLASSLFAVMNVLVRLSSARVPWSEVASARGITGALVAVLVARTRGVPLTIHDRKLSWARSLFGTGALLCGFYSMGSRGMALGDAVTLQSLSPIFVAVLAPWLLGERGGRRVWVATAVAFAGVALVAGPTFHVAAHLAGIATLGAFLSAMAMIWLRRLGRVREGFPKESPEAIVAHFSIVAATVTTMLALRDFRMPDAAGALMLAATGITGGLAQIAMTRAYALEKAARLGPVSYLGVVLSHVGGAALLGETTGSAQMVGTALVVGAGVVLAIAAMRDAQAG
ncbi:Putative membrane protein [Minicystis rosea]|nr:Putative membrane protein [Minicystis rosea]